MENVRIIRGRLTGEFKLLGFKNSGLKKNSKIFVWYNGVKQVITLGERRLDTYTYHIKEISWESWNLSKEDNPDSVTFSIRCQIK